MKRRDNFVFFWGSSNVFSNWHPSPFNYRGIQFAQNEQWMMYGKAMLFGDKEKAREILEETDPKENKRQGREVSGFVESVWNNNADRIVQVGLREKYLQNPKMLTTLLKTRGYLLVEASPYDKIWGIGLKDSHPDATHPDRWPGQNKLGQLQTDLRDWFDLNRDNLPERAQAALRVAETHLSKFSQSPLPK